MQEQKEGHTLMTVTFQDSDGATSATVPRSKTSPKTCPVQAVGARPYPWWEAFSAGSRVLGSVRGVIYEQL